ncbi:MAG: hypothetical protein A2144_14450 [Chloroflexi bacterium RBG_16_50_9]|nr:MAG: hypothetical protein A2144_14450 [Chloroflexi bacterium RBG_16_50_9]
MSVKVHFESMTPGMLAKLDTRYRIKNNHPQGANKLHGNGFSNHLQMGLFEKFGRTIAIRNK